MQVATLIRSYGLTHYLRAVIKSYDWVDKVFIVNGRFPGVKEREDKTREIAEGCNQKNVEVFTTDSQDLHQALNFGIEKLQDYKYIFIADSDELITRKDQQTMLAGMEGERACGCTIIDYVDDLNHKLPHRGHQPVVIIDSKERFHNVRCVGFHVRRFDDIYLHHFGYVFNKEDITWKLNWERRWENSSVDDMLCQGRLETKVPKEIMDMLNA